MSLMENYQKNSWSASKPEEKNEFSSDKEQSDEILLNFCPPSKAKSTQNARSSDEFSFSAFDPMNLIETAFCTLHKKPSQKKRIDLSPDGKSFLQTTDQGYGLPTSLAEPTILGLLWMTMDKNGFSRPELTFSLRELVEEYMYPNKFTDYRASWRTITAVERELHRVAATRIHSSRWYDGKLGKQVDVDAAIIDSIVVEEKGGGKTPKILRVRWGNEIYKSVLDKYTKGLDLQKFLKLKPGLELRIYRWLDRQLAEKDVQKVKSCQNWAKYKLLMQSYKIDKGGRTASNYILREVRKVLECLKGLEFSVELAADKSKADFSFTFSRIAGRENRVLTTDLAGDLVLKFQEEFHGISNAKRINPKDRRQAADWLDKYGKEKAFWMVTYCKKLHKEGPYGKQPAYSFSRLSFYEGVAEAKFERIKDRDSQSLRSDDKKYREILWRKYKEAVIGNFTKEMTDGELDKLVQQASYNVRTKDEYKYDRQGGEKLIERAIERELRKLKLEECDFLSKEEFFKVSTVDILYDILSCKHGLNPLAPERK